MAVHACSVHQPATRAVAHVQGVRGGPELQAAPCQDSLPRRGGLLSSCCIGQRPGEPPGDQGALTFGSMAGPLIWPHRLPCPTCGPPWQHARPTTLRLACLLWPRWASQAPCCTAHLPLYPSLFLAERPLPLTSCCVLRMAAPTTIPVSLLPAAERTLTYAATRSTQTRACSSACSSAGVCQRLPSLQHGIGRHAARQGHAPSGAPSHMCKPPKACR